MSRIRNADSYLAAALTAFQDTCAAGFADEFEAKQALWRAAIVIYEIADDPDSWLDELRDTIGGILKSGRIEGTLKSAARRAGSNYGR